MLFVVLHQYLKASATILPVVSELEWKKYFALIHRHLYCRRFCRAEPRNPAVRMVFFRQCVSLPVVCPPNRLTPSWIAHIQKPPFMFEEREINSVFNYLLGLTGSGLIDLGISPPDTKAFCSPNFPNRALFLYSLLFVQHNNASI